MPDLTGAILNNRYQVITQLGRGGMAEVYQVWDQQRSVYLAMKLLREDISEDRVFLRRLKREAQTLARLQHPNIVRFYGLEQDAALAFILMEYIEGTSLRREIFEANGPLEPIRALEIMRPVCAALHFAHSQGFIHCDIKPGNILIDKGGRIFVTDFGIARMADAATITLAGVGTPAYMAPEQALGEDPKPQVDIYGLGVILFEMLTGGERPFTGERARTTGSTSEKVRWEHLHMSAPSPRKYNPKIQPLLEAVILKCLEKKPQDRFQSVIELLSALESAVTGKAREESLRPAAVPPPLIPVERPATQPASPPVSKPPSPPVSQDQMVSAPKPGPRRKIPVWLWFAGGGIVVSVLALAFISGGFTNNTIKGGSTDIPAETSPIVPAGTPIPEELITTSDNETELLLSTNMPALTLTATRTITITPIRTFTPTHTLTSTPSLTSTSTIPPQPTSTETKVPKKTPAKTKPPVRPTSPSPPTKTPGGSDPPKP